MKRCLIGEQKEHEAQTNPDRSHPDVRLCIHIGDVVRMDWHLFGDGEDEMNILEMIVELRGGVPESCDFCGQPYNDKRQPTPDEGGMWACTECWDQWDKEDKEKMK